MSKVHVLLCPEDLYSSLVRIRHKPTEFLNWVETYRSEYDRTHTFQISSNDPMEAAEEVFDITNNPSREDECNEIYGCHRPVNVGDIVVVDGTSFLCENVGWTAI